jgi:2-desacetyl-2-hydroxyethyl bacteriochlorophyllide A dehydrogenase
VIAADMIPLRVDLSRSISADRAVSVPEEDLAHVVLAESPDGADVVIDTTGSARLVSQCVELVRREGRICLQGYYPDPVAFDFHATHLKRVTVAFPCGWDSEEVTHLSQHLAAGRIQISPLITHRVSYREAAETYQWILDKPEQSLGVVLDWSALD